jgi:hypothetical protein
MEGCWISDTGYQMPDAGLGVRRQGVSRDGAFRFDCRLPEGWGLAGHVSPITNCGETG